MPPGPEFGNGFGVIGPVEIGHQAEPHHSRGPHGNIGIAGKIAEYLEREKHGGKKKLNAFKIFRVLVNGVHDPGQVVGDDEFLEKTPDHQSQAIGTLVESKPVFFEKLGDKMSGALDGTGHQLGEKGDIGGIDTQVFFRFFIAPVNIDNIT